jgi:NAD(P)H-hydrate epimerase
MLLVTAEQMRELDRQTIHEFGVPSLTLMERAGAAVVEALIQRFPRHAKKGVLIVAGKGNNGGDGFVVARLLKKKRIPCEVSLLARRDEVSPDSAHNLRSFLKLKGKVTEVSAGNLAALSERCAKSGLIVDAVFGTGMKNEIRGVFADAIAAMNAAGAPIVAVDIPSGLDSDRGTPLGAAIQAEMTVSLGYAKVGEVIYPGVDYVGELVVADIGIDERALSSIAPPVELLDGDRMSWLVPRRAADSHKGSNGHLLVLAGARGKTGAAILACRAAMRAGAGLVTLASARSLNPIFAAALTEVMTESLADDAHEVAQPLGDSDWRRLLERKSALLFGPGIGVNSATQNQLRWLLRNLDIPWVIDADGLNNLALELDRLRHARTPPILTPHPGEMARLCGLDNHAINADRIAVARGFAMEHRCHLVLKGARTVIATADGKAFINPTGNPGMASAGMGDVLAGILTALLGQGLGAEDAMKLGVYLHGHAGDRVAAHQGQIGLIASDILDDLPSALQALADRHS